MNVQESRASLIATLDDVTFANVVSFRGKEINWDLVCDTPELNELKALYESSEAKIRESLSFKKLVKWAFHNYQESLKPRLSDTDHGHLAFKINSSDAVNWIRTDRLFVTVVSKSNEPSVLPTKLLDALKYWNPEPHRLLMSKMRAALDKVGVIAEGTVLSNKSLQAGWLNEYLTDEPADRHAKVGSTINKHWDSLGGVIRNEINDFAQRLADLISAEGRSAVMTRWYDSVTDEDMHSQLNHYACSKPVEGTHLNTGHILKIPDAARNSHQIWLCLSPACDLVPGQKNTGWPGRLGQHMPFVAVELYETTKEHANSNAFGSNFLFLTIGDSLKFYSFTPIISKKSPSTDSEYIDEKVSNPKWEQMFAASQGIFNPQNGERKLKVLRTRETQSQLQMVTEEATIVAQLRYEYALNLLQRIGTNFSRIGLDFVELAKKKTIPQTVEV